MTQRPAYRRPVRRGRFWSPRRDGLVPPGLPVTGGALIAGVLALGSWLAAASSAGAALRLAPDRLGPLRVGMTAPEMTEALGQPVTRQPGAYGCSSFTVPTTEGRAQLLAVRGARLQLVMVYARGLRTTGGVQIGDSLDKLRARYPRLSRAPAGNSLSGAEAYYWVTRRRGGHVFVLRFSISRGRVRFMDAGRRSDVIGFGECA